MAKSFPRPPMLALVAAALLLASCSGDGGERAAAKGAPDPTLTRSAVIERYFEGREARPIEGIWLDAGGAFEVAIVPNRTSVNANWPFVALVINSSEPGWQRGQTRFYLRTATLGSAHDVLIDGQGATLIQQGANTLDAMLPSLVLPNKRVRLLRAYPEIAQEAPNLRRPREEESERRRRRSGGSGTGFFVAGDILATNQHVAAGAKKITFILGEETLEAEMIRFDGRLDLALVRLKKKARTRITCVSLDRTEDIQRGEKVFALGHPIPSLLSTDLKVSEGIVNSPRGEQNDSSRLQHSAPVQPGNSGSPLLDEFGRVVGVVDSRFDYGRDGRPNQNVNFAVKVRFLKEMLATVDARPCDNNPGPSSAKLDAKQIFDRYNRAVVRLDLE